MDVDESFKVEEQSFKCYICHVEFVTKGYFKKHKKLEHPINVKVCEKFLANKCERSEEKCWYTHEYSESSSLPKPGSASAKSSGFHKAPKNPPPDQLQTVMEAVNNLCLKVLSMEKRFTDLMN